MDLSNHVILPNEDYIALQEAAWDPIPIPVKDRIGSSVQTLVILSAVAGVVTASSWGWAKAVNWLEDRRFQRDMMLSRSNKS